MHKIYFTLLLAFSIKANVYSQSQADSALYTRKESVWLSKKVGLWSVTMTMQPAIGAKPLVVKGLEAERMMVGAFCLHETMQPSKGAAMPLFKRISDLDYNFNEARWDYISIDTRITAGIMFFTNYGASGDSIVSYMLDFPNPGFGPGQTGRGQTLRAKNVVLTIDANHDVVKQYWKLTDGEEWLAVVYDYVRKK